MPPSPPLPTPSELPPSPPSPPVAGPNGESCKPVAAVAAGTEEAAAAAVAAVRIRGVTVAAAAAVAEDQAAVAAGTAVRRRRRCRTTGRRSRHCRRRRCNPEGVGTVADEQADEGVRSDRRRSGTATGWAWRTWPPWERRTGPMRRRRELGSAPRWRRMSGRRTGTANRRRGIGRTALERDPPCRSHRRKYRHACCGAAGVADQREPACANATGR